MELEIRRINGIDNINNSDKDDQHCFKWQTTRAVFPPKEKPGQKKNIVNGKLREQARKKLSKD